MFIQKKTICGIKTPSILGIDSTPLTVLPNEAVKDSVAVLSDTRSVEIGNLEKEGIHLHFIPLSDATKAKTIKTSKPGVSSFQFFPRINFLVVKKGPSYYSIPIDPITKLPTIERECDFVFLKTTENNTTNNSSLKKPLNVVLSDTKFVCVGVEEKTEEYKQSKKPESEMTRKEKMDDFFFRVLGKYGPIVHEHLFIVDVLSHQAERIELPFKKKKVCCLSICGRKLLVSGQNEFLLIDWKTKQILSHISDIPLAVERFSERIANNENMRKNDNLSKPKNDDHNEERSSLSLASTRALTSAPPTPSEETDQKPTETLDSVLEPKKSPDYNKPSHEFGKKRTSSKKPFFKFSKKGSSGKKSLLLPNYKKTLISTQPRSILIPSMKLMKKESSKPFTLSKKRIYKTKFDHLLRPVFHLEDIQGILNSNLVVFFDSIDEGEMYVLDVEEKRVVKKILLNSRRVRFNVLNLRNCVVSIGVNCWSHKIDLGETLMMGNKVRNLSSVDDGKSQIRQFYVFKHRSCRYFLSMETKKERVTRFSIKNMRVTRKGSVYWGEVDVGREGNYGECDLTIGWEEKERVEYLVEESSGMLEKLKVVLRDCGFGLPRSLCLL